MHRHRQSNPLVSYTKYIQVFNREERVSGNVYITHILSIISTYRVVPTTDLQPLVHTRTHARTHFRPIPTASYYVYSMFCHVLVFARCPVRVQLFNILFYSCCINTT